MNLPLFIAKRIYSDNDAQQKVSKPAIRIATAGVAVGLAVMIVSVCIVLGFKHTIRDKVIGFGSHITVANFMTIHGNGQRPIAINDSMTKVLRSVNGVRHVQRYALKQGILKTDSDFLGVAFKGIAAEYDTTFIHNNMVSGCIPTFSDETSHNKIVISKIMADMLKIKTGDKVFAYFIDNDNVRMRRFLVSGIYQTNLTQYDKTICFTDLYTAVRLNGWNNDQVTGAEIIVNDFNKVNDVEDILVSKVNRTTDSYGETYSSETIQESNPQIFSWLDLLDLNVWIILALMLCVAGFTMISGLLIIILERTNMIGVLKALGAKNKTIRKTFLWFAVFIIGKGMIIGNVIGLGLVIIQNVTGMVTLDPSTYYVKTVPVEINIPLIVILNIATLLISVFVLIAPSFLISRIHPAKSMRYE
ncbi:FtsX-like permease family protein [uncultured Prevotella sp.]|uniref:ABC transporter permease n=1 Tax=uncultured Prevotella sp. TaxID=159272 RepID=UPI0025FB2453|nr:FtsX-like permease family protein [uncultured Prevotella sp.]